MASVLRRAAATVLLLHGGAHACTIIAVGKDASASGAPMVGHSEDSGPMTNDIRLVRVPRKTWPEGSMRPLYKVAAGYPRLVDEARSPEYAPVSGQQTMEPLAYIPQVPMTYAYWDTDYAVHNEKGVVIGESTCTAMTAGWPADVPHGHNRAGIEELSKIALERCTTGRCAVETMGKIAVELGFYSADSGDPAKPVYSGTAECLTVADATGEVWNFNILTGKNNASAIWAAQRMPHDHIIAVGNAFTIRKMNLSDSENFVYSPGVTELAVEKGWWSPKDESSPEIFDFFSAYGYTPGMMGEAVVPPNLKDLLGYYSSRRMWRIFSKLSPEEGAKLDATKANLPKTVDPYPSSVPAPRGSVTLKMVTDLYRDHYEGTEFDLTQGMAAGPYGNPNRAPVPPGHVGLWERAISMYRTTWSFVNVARPGGKSILWFGYDAPHGTSYLPFYGAATSGAPECYHSHEGTMSKFSFKVAYWPFNMVNTIQDVNFRLINADVRAKAAKVQSEAERLTKVWEAEADAANSTEKALALLTARCNDFVDKAVADWWDYAFSLFARFSRYVVTSNDTEKGENLRAYAYPAWWVSSPDVGYSTWTPHGPFHGVLLIPGNSTTAGVPGALASGTALIFGAMLLGLVVATAAFQAGSRWGRHQERQAPKDFYHAQL